MFRIRKVNDPNTEANRSAIAQVQAIARQRFPLLKAGDLDKLSEQLTDPVQFRYRTILFVAESARERIKGFAILLHFPDHRACYLDLLAASPDRTGRGIGAALYERVRDEALQLQTVGLFFETLPDDPALSRDPTVRKDNQARLQFYERYGAAPILNTAYETPLKPGSDNPPYLMLDNLGHGTLPSRAAARGIVRAILERKYAGKLPPGYTDMVVASIKDDPIRLRPPRYAKPAVAAPAPTPLDRRIALVVTDQHAIHHVHERGYVQSPVRIRSILAELDKTDLFEKIPPRHYGENYIRAVHDPGFVDYLQRACAMVEPGKSLYPYVFPIRNAARPPKDLPMRAGYYCIDTFTPLNQNAYLAAKRAVDCAMTAADLVLGGQHLAYALVRPPGHHAERGAFGGFCYFNNAAIAAHYLSRYGRVAVLDIDYHHGNGTQEIFYQRADVLTVSIHGHPSFAYPYFSGFRDEIGGGPGTGFNVNIPLPETVDGERYREALEQALRQITRFAPSYLVVANGFDTAAGDPTGSFTLRPKDFFLNGQRIGRLGYPTVIVQEGGYRTRSLGAAARQFLTGLWQGWREHPMTAKQDHIGPPRKAAPHKRQELTWREKPRPGDVDAVRGIVTSSGFFSEAEIAIAMELVEERLQKGLASGYHFLFAEDAGRMVGYACFGPTAGTRSSYDLYWIAVSDDRRRGGLGRQILARSEEEIARLGGTRIYVETSSRAQYEPTRGFYLQQGYSQVAELTDFYGPSDGKVIFVKVLDRAAAA